MSILAIETSAAACSLAVRSGGEIYSRHEVAPMQQAAQILPLIDELLLSVGVSLGQLQGIAFGQGPGSFTGLRIAAAVAKGFAFALEIPVIPVSSLSILAFQSASTQRGLQKILTAIDARMGEIYWASFEACEGGHRIRPITAPALCRPQALTMPELGVWSGVGNAWKVYGREMGFQPECVFEDANPKAEVMLPLAELLFQAGGSVSAVEACPVYLRNNVTFGQSVLDSPVSGR